MQVSQKPVENKRSDITRNIIGTAAGASIGFLPVVGHIKKMVTPVSATKIAIRKLQMSENHLELDSFENIKSYAEDIIAKTPALKNNNVKFFIATPETLKNRPELPQNASVLKKMMYEMAKNKNIQYANGLNACFSSRNNIIKINDKSLYSAVFHELGHATNFNNGKIMKQIQKMRGISFLAAPIVGLSCLTVGLFHNDSKPQKDREVNSKRPKIDRVLSFMKNNAGKLTFLTFFPIIFEEGVASIKGIRMSKPYLNPSQLKQHKKNLARAFGSYLSFGIMLSSLMTFGIFIKQAIVNNKKSN